MVPAIFVPTFKVKVKGQKSALLNSKGQWLCHDL